MRTRLLLSAAAGIVVALMASICIWQTERNLLQRGEHYALDVRQGYLIEALEDFRAAKGRYPGRLAEVTLREHAQKSIFEFDASDEPLDPWGSRFEHATRGDSFTL